MDIKQKSDKVIDFINQVTLSLGFEKGVSDEEIATLLDYRNPYGADVLNTTRETMLRWLEIERKTDISKFSLQVDASLNFGQWLKRIGLDPIYDVDEELRRMRVRKDGKTGRYSITVVLITPDGNKGMTSEELFVYRQYHGFKPVDVSALLAFAHQYPFELKNGPVINIDRTIKGRQTSFPLSPVIGHKDDKAGKRLVGYYVEGNPIKGIRIISAV